VTRHLIVVVALLAMVLTFACGEGNEQMAADTVPTAPVTATQRAEDESVTMTPTQAATAAPPIAAATRVPGEPVTMTPADVATTATPIATGTQESEEPATMTPAEVATKAPSTPTPTLDTGDTQQGQRVAVSGVLNVMWGDPPPDTGLPPRMQYILTDKQGQHWSLVFDENVYWPPGGLLVFDREQVKVEGTLTAEGGILVDSIRLE
jgi:hypothetical protein